MSLARLLSPIKFCETTYFWKMITILGKGFISCLIQVLIGICNYYTFRKYILYWGFYEPYHRKAATTCMQGCHLRYTDTLMTTIVKGI